MMTTMLEEIGRIKRAKLDIREAIISKGVEVPEDERIDSYASRIAGIRTGGNTGAELSGFVVANRKDISFPAKSGFKLQEIVRRLDIPLPEKYIFTLGDSHKFDRLDIPIPESCSFPISFISNGQIEIIKGDFLQEDVQEN